MVFNPFGFVLGSVQAEREGVNDPQARNRLAVVGGLFGSPVTSLALTTVLARREAEAQAAPANGAPANGAPANGAPDSGLVPVPSLKNLPLELAKATLTGQDLNPRPVEVVNFDFAKGLITEQNPEADTLVPVRSTVTLFVSKGFPLPNVVEPERLTIEEARQLLRRTLGLKVNETREPSDEVDEDSVISQSPEAGTLVSRRDTVTLTVSEGKKELANYLGQQAQVARDALQDRDYEVKLVPAEAYDQNKEIYEVVAQDPPGGTEVARETQVTLTINPYVLEDFAQGDIQYWFARDRLQDLDVKTRYTNDGDDQNKKQMEIVGQDPAAGTPIDPESLVKFRVVNVPIIG